MMYYVGTSSKSAVKLNFTQGNDDDKESDYDYIRDSESFGFESDSQIDKFSSRMSSKWGEDEVKFRNAVFLNFIAPTD